MARIIGISGPSPAGKTTLLNGLKTKQLIIDDFKVSRTVQAQLGWESLDAVLTDPGTMMAFQQKVSDVKYAREQENLARADFDLIITERTFADIASWAQLWTWELAHAGKWSIREAVEFAMGFVDQCVSRQYVYDGNIMLSSVPHEADPHRAKEEHIEYITGRLEHFFEAKNPKDVPVFRITESSIQGRINQAHNWITTL